jgi:beta-lactamase class A
MFPNNQLGWAGSSSNYTHSEASSSPFWRSTIVVFALIATAFTATAATVNVLASSEVAYEPGLDSQRVAPPAAAPEPPAANQPAVAAAPAANLDKSIQIQAVLDAWAKSHSSQQWSVIVQGLGNDTSKAAISAGSSFNTASIYKLFLMYPLFQAYSSDSLSSTYVTVDGRGSVSLKNCVELMIKNSDNPCGEAVGRKLGWAKANKMLKILGLKSTNLNNPNGITTTSADTALFLEKLYSGQVLTDENQQYVLGLMQQQRYRSGIPAGCPSCTVSDKTGDIGVARHDAGIVQYQGGAYVLSIFTNGASYAQIAQLTREIQSVISS